MTPWRCGVATSESTRLIRGIGFAGGAFIVLNGMIGAGIFALPAVIAERAGVLSPWLFLGAGLMIITIVLTLAELASYFSRSGGPVLYATEAFGPLTGFVTGWIYYVSRVAAVAANTHVMAVYLGTVWSWFDTPSGHSTVIVVVCAFLTIVNVTGVKGSIKVLSLLTFLKAIPLLLLVLAGLRSIGPDVLFPASIPTVEDLGGTMLLLVYAFVGFESILIPAGETSRPRRTIPRALLMTVVITAVFYFLIMLVYVAVLPPDGTADHTLVDVGRQLAGPIGAVVITLTAVFSIGGNLSSTTLAVPRLTLSLAEHGLLPEWFGRTHPKYATPANSVIFFGGLAIVLGLTGSFVFLAVASSLTRLITFIVCILALPVIRGFAGEVSSERAFRLPGGYLVPILALGVCVWMAWHSTLQSWLYVGALLVFGLLLYGMEKVVLRKS